MRGIMWHVKNLLRFISKKYKSRQLIKYFKTSEKAEVKLIKPDELDKLIDLLENEAKVI